MGNFKKGEKVVFIGDKYGKDKMMLFPKINEIVTVNGFSKYSEGNLYISEYLTAKDGINQSFTPCCFRKLDYEFAENLLKEISESVNQKHLQN